MQVNRELDYNTVYNGRAEEVAKMIISHFDKNVKFLSKEEVLPDRSDRDNVVGAKYKFVLFNDYVIVCGINIGVSFMIESISGNKTYITEAKYMTWVKKKELAFKHDEETVKEKIEILEKVIQMTEKGEEIVKVDIEG